MKAEEINILIDKMKVFLKYLFQYGKHLKLIIFGFLLAQIGGVAGFYGFFKNNKWFLLIAWSLAPIGFGFFLIGVFKNVID